MYSTEISPYMFTSIYLINLSNFHSFRIKVLGKNVFPRSNVNKLPKYFGLGQNTPYVHPSFVQVYRSNWSNSLYNGGWIRTLLYSGPARLFLQPETFQLSGPQPFPVYPIWRDLWNQQSTYQESKKDVSAIYMFK